jgi:PAS domain S-box-containing protein
MMIRGLRSRALERFRSSFRLRRPSFRDRLLKIGTRCTMFHVTGVATMTSSPPTPGPDPYRELFERSADAILIIEGETFVDCNQAAVDMLRCTSRSEVLQTHPSELSPPTQPDGRESYEKANAMIEIAFERGSHRFEWDHKRADGEVFPVEVLLTAVQRGEKPILHVVWRDITERVRLESDLRQSQKMQAVGLLAGGIAHDFNNLLIAILGNAEMLADELTDPIQREASIEIRSAAQRAATLTRQLLTFSRKRPVRREQVSLGHSLTGLEKLLRRTIGENIRLVTTTPDAPVHVKADPGQVEQVLLNLVTNARDAMPDGGSLTVEIRQETFSPDTTGRPVGLAPGRFAVLEVSDTGTGMDEATMARAFEPFFTTKSMHEGTGMGLSIVHGIATQSGGTVTLSSVMGEGTTVRAYFPLSKEPCPTSRPASRTGRGHEGTETILVVEDEPAVRVLVRRTLQRCGYQVRVAGDGRQALSMWDEDDGRSIDLIVSDVVMPNMSGPRFLEELRRRGASPRFLFMSGYAHDAVEKLSTDRETEFIEKPFSGHALAAKVRALLDIGR